MDKLYYKNGTARLVIILAVIAVFLTLVVFVPIISNYYQNRLENVDKEYITTAEKMAREEYIENPEAFTKVYDSINKKFVNLENIEDVPYYANADSHEDMYLVVTVDESGNVTSEWMTKKDIKELEKEV